jgi:hypothetical protein
MRSANAIKVHRKSGVAESTCHACPGLPWGVPWRDLLFFPPTPILSSVTFSLRHSTSYASFFKALAPAQS